MDKKLKEFIAEKKLSDEAILSALQAAEKGAAAPESESEEPPDSDAQTESEESEPAEKPTATEPAKGIELKLADLKAMIQETITAELKPKAKKPEPRPKPKLPQGFELDKFNLVA
jgi:hypothetical protein